MWGLTSLRRSDAHIFAVSQIDAHLTSVQAGAHNPPVLSGSSSASEHAPSRAYLLALHSSNCTATGTGIPRTYRADARALGLETPTSARP
jgi:hypothetical protein